MEKQHLHKHRSTWTEVLYPNWKKFCPMPAEIKESTNIEVQTIDFAHMSPSNKKDEGYIFDV